MALNRVTPWGWLEETGTTNRVTPGGWLQETVAGAAAQTLTQSSSFTNTNTFYTHTLATTATLTQSSTHTNTATFYTHALSFDQVLAQGDIFVDTNSFYTHNLLYPQNLTQSSTYSNTNSFYTHSVSSSSFTPTQLAEIAAYLLSSGAYNGVYFEAIEGKAMYLLRL